MDLENVRLPGRNKKNRKSKAPELYARSGRTDYSPSSSEVRPVSLDPEAMQQVLDQLLLSEHREQLEMQRNQALDQMRLPSAVPGGSMMPR